MNDYYEDIGLIYEAFSKRGNPNIGSAKNTSRSYPPGQSDNVHHSYGPHIPFKDPGGSGNAWDGAQGSQGITAPVSDEESDVDSSTFMRNDILKKIDILTKDAESFEDVKTILALSELKRFVETL